MSTTLAKPVVERTNLRWSSTLLWPLAFLISFGFLLAPKGFLPKWAFELPRPWRVPVPAWISDGMSWLVDQATFGFVTFKELTRGFAALMEWPLWLATSLLSSGFMEGQGSAAIVLTPPISWAGILFFVTLLAWHLGGRSLALLVGAAFLYLVLFGQWASAMVTLASIAIAVPFAALGGLLIGVACYRSTTVERVVRPILDLMQTVPIFAYLVPVLFLFGFGPVAAMLATIIYAMPPMVRVTLLALQQAPEDIKEYASMAGCTGRQEMWWILIPAMRANLMVGVNQTIMLSLNMVIIASMIGAGGLGYDVLTSLRRLDIGGGLEAGLAITVLAIALDRLSQAMAYRTADDSGMRRIILIGCVGAIALSALGLIIPALGRFPESLQVSTAFFWASLVEWLNVNYFDTFEAIKTFVLLNILVPVKRFLLAQPWPWVAFVLTLAGYLLGQLRLALLCLALTLFVVLVGQWKNAMISLYLCGVSVVIAALLGVPIGILCGLSNRLWRVVQVVIDALQTLPSFVYLIPVVMLFRVGDFAAMVAIIAYAIAPAIRYTAHGVRRIDKELIEAGTASGCTPFQILTKIRIPLAIPEVLLGINQTIMLALSMLVITALVGTRDLGQEVYVALTKADVGRGITAGLCVAFIAIIADRMIAAQAEQLKARNASS